MKSTDTERQEYLGSYTGNEIASILRLQQLVKKQTQVLTLCIDGVVRAVPLVRQQMVISFEENENDAFAAWFHAPIADARVYS